MAQKKSVLIEYWSTVLDRSMPRRVALIPLNASGRRSIKAPCVVCGRQVATDFSLGDYPYRVYDFMVSDGLVLLARNKQPAASFDFELYLGLKKKKHIRDKAGKDYVKCLAKRDMLFEIVNQEYFSARTLSVYVDAYLALIRMLQFCEVGKAVATNTDCDNKDSQRDPVAVVACDKCYADKSKNERIKRILVAASLERELKRWRDSQEVAGRGLGEARERVEEFEAVLGPGALLDSRIQELEAEIEKKLRSA